jgi:hypothetical protein
MIRPRLECPCCGTKFTPDSDNDVTCGECLLWQRDELSDTPPIGFGESAHDAARSIANYRAVTRPRR